jgi:excisionase family DNA binding protein
MRATTTISPCLTKKEVAQRLNVSVRKVEYMIAEGEIIGYKIGKVWRMRPENLERWIENKEKVA